ncbi:MAG TPA: phosphatase PAP2 family protein [Allosphingosinicella sp.]|nr:phosphatase PAP2 family protein [Allosphingosinicella sp.]
MARKKNKPIEQAAEAALEADAAVAEAAEPYAKTPLVRAISLLSEIGDQPPMRALCAAVVGAGVVAGSPRLTRAGLRMIAAHTLATEAKNVVKRRIDRTRPRTDRNHKLKPGRRTDKETTSFPSGHSAGAIAVAQAYAREFPEHRAAALAGAGAIALAQIPRCAHYPTDVGAGLALGLASEALVDRSFDPVLDALVPLLPAAVATRLVEEFQLSGEESEA